MHYVLAHPEQVARLALVNTFPVYRRQLRIRLACRLAPSLRRPGVRRLKRWVVEQTLASEGVAAEDRRRYGEVVAGVYLPAYCRRLELVRDVDLRDRLGEIGVPTLIFAA